MLKTLSVNTLIAGQFGGIGGRIVELLRAADVPVRALVRRDDNRAASLRQLGAEVIVADLIQPEQVMSAIHGCRRVYFEMGVSPSYLEATLVTAAAALEIAGFELLVNMSQVTVSELDLKHMTDSPQQRLHWLCEQALNWSGLPVVHLRPTVFQQNFFFWDWAAESIARSGNIRLHSVKAEARRSLRATSRRWPRRYCATRPDMPVR